MLCMTAYVGTEPASVVFKRLEHEHRTHLPRNSFAVIRVDGKGFSKYARGLEWPFDAKFAADMQATALFLAEQIQGAVAAYTQSDEISVVLSDLSSPEARALVRRAGAEDRLDRGIAGHGQVQQPPP
jgi:tRNA(His) 5'-end guanylyltransferase